VYNKRTFVGIAAAALLAACSNVTDIDRANKDTGPLKLNAVNVDTSAMTIVSEGRTVNRTKAQLASDLRAAITREAQSYSNPNGLPADVNVTVEKLHLATIVDRVVAGTSYVESTISVVDAADGSVIIAPTKVKGNEETLRGFGSLGAAGAVQNASVETDYKNAIDGYAKALIASIAASQ
jgi:hypothetical protein